MSLAFLPNRHAVKAESLRPSISEAVERLQGSIHLWQFDLKNHRDIDVGECSQTELRRARLFASRRDGTQFLTSRVLLRQVLSGYSGILEGKLEIVSRDRRKPSIRGCSLPFNVSHSGGQLAIAIRSAGQVGVDIQKVKLVEYYALARALFDPSELRFLDGLSDRERRNQFFRIWVCREAILKLVGIGFEGKGLALRRMSDGSYYVADSPTGWGDIALSEFASPEGFVGAVAWSRQSEALQIKHFVVN